MLHFQLDLNSMSLTENSTCDSILWMKLYDSSLHASTVHFSFDCISSNKFCNPIQSMNHELIKLMWVKMNVKREHERKSNCTKSRTTHELPNWLLKAFLSLCILNQYSVNQLLSLESFSPTKGKFTQGKLVLHLWEKFLATPENARLTFINFRRQKVKEAHE